MKIFVNFPINLSEDVPWSAKNGATRRHLKVISKLSGQLGEKDELQAKVGILDKGNHSFIFLNDPSNSDDRIIGLFLNSAYGYSLMEGEEMYSASSFGGYGNGESKFGLYSMGSVIKVHTYKHRRSPSYFRLGINGWEHIQPEVYEAQEQQEI